MIPWHRLFGLILDDFFTGSPFVVETEKDLSSRQQRLDVVVIRRQPGEFVGVLPDGFDTLVDHNLISFKSFQESFDLWTVQELVGHYVNYRKQISPDPNALIPPETIRLFGVTARHPTQLSNEVALKLIQPRVYDIQSRIAPVRLIVVHDLPLSEANSSLLLFSASQENIAYARDHFHLKNPETSTLLHRLLVNNRDGGPFMPYTMKDFMRDVVKEMFVEIPLEEILQELPVEARLKGIPTEKRLEGIPTEKRLEGIPTEKRLEGIPTEKRLEGLSSEERLAGLSSEERLMGIPREELERLLRELDEGNNPKGDQPQ